MEMGRTSLQTEINSSVSIDMEIQMDLDNTNGQMGTLMLENLRMDLSMGKVNGEKDWILDKC